MGELAKAGEARDFFTWRDAAAVEMPIAHCPLRVMVGGRARHEVPYRIRAEKVLEETAINPE